MATSAAEGRCRRPSPPLVTVALIFAAAVGPASEAVVLRRAVNQNSSLDELLNQNFSWPEGLSLTPAPGVPRRQWFLNSEDDSWGRAQHIWRKMLMGRTEEYGNELNGLATDDIPDSFLPRDLDHYQPENQGLFWDAMCNGTMKMLPSTHAATSNCSAMDGSSTSAFYPCLCGAITCRVSEICTDGATPVCKARLPLDDYKVQNGSGCALADQLPGDEITSEAKAFMECGGKCSAVMDVGCERKYFRLCKVGAPYVKEENATDCLRMRVPDHPAPAGGARPPIELKFWKAFCESRTSEIKFRPLFKGRLCANGKVIADAFTEPMCAEKTAADASCGPVFDFKDGSPTGAPNVCRCLAAAAQCNAPAPTGAPNKFQNVFIRE